MEYFDICDESGLLTGEIIDRETAHRDGILHRTAHVWIVRKKTQGYDILLQKRSMEKDSFPGLYDTSSAGHIPTGSEPLPSAIRELKEELGIVSSVKLNGGDFVRLFGCDFTIEDFDGQIVSWCSGKIG